MFVKRASSTSGLAATAIQDGDRDLLEAASRGLLESAGAAVFPGTERTRVPMEWQGAEHDPQTELAACRGEQKRPGQSPPQGPVAQDDGAQGPTHARTQLYGGTERCVP